MNIWKLVAPNKIEHATAPDLKATDSTAKVKITKALLSDADVGVYSGEVKVKYPVVLGRYALGQVVDAGENCFMNKGDRVYLADVIEDECAEDGIRIAGESTDGFYRDFVLVDASNAYVLPANVPDEAGLLIDAVALAEKTVSELGIKAGQYVLVVGGGLYANVLCQILMYRRAVPVLAENNPARLQSARKSGIYYTFPNDETLKDNLFRVTGGNLADCSVFFAFSNKSEPSRVFSLVRRDAYVAFCTRVNKNLTVNLEAAMKNNVTVKAISESREFVSMAINDLSNKAVDFGAFAFAVSPEDKLPLVLESASRSDDDLTDEVNVLKFIF